MTKTSLCQVSKACTDSTIRGELSADTANCRRVVPPIRRRPGYRGSIRLQLMARIRDWTQAYGYFGQRCCPCRRCVPTHVVHHQIASSADDVFAGYKEYKTGRTYMARMGDWRDNKDIEIPLDGIGGVNILVKADVHRSGKSTAAIILPVMANESL